MTKVQIAAQFNVSLATVNIVSAWMTVNHADYNSWLFGILS